MTRKNGKITNGSTANYVSRVKGTMKTCDVCGKEFYFAGQGYIYKHRAGDKMVHFCGWNCMRKWEERTKNNDEN